MDIMYQPGQSRVQTRGGSQSGKGRGFPRSKEYARSDNNRFAVLSDDFEQNGDQMVFSEQSDVNGERISESCGNSMQGQFMTVEGKGRGKRLRLSDGSTGGEGIDLSAFASLPTDQNLCHMMSSLSANQNQMQNMQTKIDLLTNMNSRLCNTETVIHSHDDRLKLLEYKSIDSEARNRRNNLLFKGVSEQANEDCFRQIQTFLLEQLNIDTSMYIHRAHRLGRFTLNKTRPIIVAFRDFGDTELIMSKANKLRGSQYGISRDYPMEIVKARQKLWPEFKKFKADAGPSDRISISYPAKLIVNKVVKMDIFPDWNRIMKGSRVSVIDPNGPYEHPGNTNYNCPSAPKSSSGPGPIYHPPMPSSDDKQHDSRSSRSWGSSVMRDLPESYTFTLGGDSDSDSSNGQGDMDYDETPEHFETDGNNVNRLQGVNQKNNAYASSLSHTPADVAENLLIESRQVITSSEPTNGNFHGNSNPSSINSCSLKSCAHNSAAMTYTCKNSTQETTVSNGHNSSYKPNQNYPISQVKNTQNKCETEKDQVPENPNNKLSEKNKPTRSRNTNNQENIKSSGNENLPKTDSKSNREVPRLQEDKGSLPGHDKKERQSRRDKMAAEGRPHLARTPSSQSMDRRSDKNKPNPKA